MFTAINDAIAQKKKDEREDRFIAESVMEVEETLPGSDEEIDDAVDPESVPEDVFKKIDDAVEKAISDPNYDDSEPEELVDDDDSDLGVSDEEIDAILDEAAGKPCPKCKKNPCECADMNEKTCKIKGTVDIEEEDDDDDDKKSEKKPKEEKEEKPDEDDEGEPEKEPKNESAHSMSIGHLRAIAEGADSWKDDEDINHPDTARRTTPKSQPLFGKNDD